MAKKAKAKVSVAGKSEKGREPSDEMRGRIVTVGVPLWQQNSRKRHLQFKAGKMYVIDNMVHPDPRKGYICIDQDDEHVMHFCWMERDAVGTKEDDLAPEPYDSIFKRVHKCTTGRVYVLKIKSTNNHHFFWMQEPAAEKDSEICAKVNYLLNFPPVWLRFPQIAWNFEMPRGALSSEYNSAVSDFDELEAPEDVEMNEVEYSPTIFERFRDQLPSFLRAYKASNSRRPPPSEDSFPQPFVGNLDLVAQLGDMLPNLEGGTGNSSGKSVKSKGVVGKMRAITAAVRNGGFGKRLQMFGFVDEYVSDLASDSDYSDVVESGDAKSRDSIPTNVNGKLQNHESGPSSAPESWNLNVEEKRASGVDGVEFHCGSTTTERTVKPETPAQDDSADVVDIVTVAYAAHDREASNSHLNVQESGSGAMDQWESITEPASTLLHENQNLIGPNAVKEDIRNRVEPVEKDNLSDGETVAIAEGWQTARSSTVDTSLVGSFQSSREFALSVCCDASEGSLWKSATDPTDHNSSTVAMILTAGDGSAVETKETPQRPLAQHLTDDNDGSLRKSQDNINTNVVALSVEVSKEAASTNCSEEGVETFVKGAKNKTQVEPSTLCCDRAAAPKQTESDLVMQKGVSSEVISGGPGDERQQSSIPQKTEEESSPPPVDSHLEPHWQDTKSYETVPSIFPTSESDRQGVGCSTEGNLKLPSVTVIARNEGGERVEDGILGNGSITGNIAMMVLGPSRGNESADQVGNHPSGSETDGNPLKSDGTANSLKECGIDDGNPATTSKSASSATRTVTSRRGRSCDQHMQNDDHPNTQGSSNTVVSGAEDPGTKSVVPTVSKSLEEVSTCDPFNEPRYKLRKRPPPIRPSQSGPTVSKGRKDGSRKKPRMSSPGLPLPVPFSVQDASPVRWNRSKHPEVCSATLVCSSNRRSGRSRKRANDDEPLENSQEAPPSKKAKVVDRSSSNSTTGTRSSSFGQHQLPRSAGGSKEPISGLPRRRSAKTDGQQTEPVKIREIKKAGPETKVRTRITPQVQPPLENRANRDRSQNTKPVIIEDINSTKPKPKDRKRSPSDRRSKP